MRLCCQAEKTAELRLNCWCWPIWVDFRDMDGMAMELHWRDGKCAGQHNCLQLFACSLLLAILISLQCCRTISVQFQASLSVVHYQSRVLNRQIAYSTSHLFMQATSSALPLASISRQPSQRTRRRKEKFKN